MKPPSAALEKRLRRFFQPLDTSSCWLWQGHVTRYGYGMLDLRHTAPWNKAFRAHRLSYAVHVGFFPPPGKMVCHHCDVRHCVNPAHLYLGDHKTNSRDAVERKRLYSAACVANRAERRALSPKQAEQVRQWAAEEKEKRVSATQPRCGCKWTQEKIRKAIGCGENTVARAIGKKVREDRPETRARNELIRSLYFGEEGHAKCRERRAYTGARTHRWMARHYGVHVSVITSIIYGYNNAYRFHPD